MTDYLEADCVLNSLFAKGIFTEKDWKLKRVTSSSYDVSFEFADSARIAGFTVYIIGTYHCIGVTALLNQARRFRLAVGDILVQCVIK